MNTMKKLGFFLGVFIIVTEVKAQVTFTKDIAKIIYNQCANCHRAGEIGPFSLTNYQEVKSFGKMIKYVTGTKYMPPWKADITYQRYREENLLTDDQIKKIGDWVDNGMPYGNITEEPAFPSYPTGSTLGKPDLTLKFDQAHIHKGNNLDDYWYFVLPTKLTENRNVKAIELRPGNKKIVHHALFFQDTTGKARNIDATTPGYGFSADNSSFNVDQALRYVQFPGYVPGQKPIRFPENMAQRLNKNSDLVIQMHYAPSPVDEKDSSTVNIFFADKDEKIDRFVRDRILLPSDLPGGFLSFFIPGNQKKKFIGKWKTTEDISVLSVFPHMHLLGRNWKVWVEKPDGKVENIIKIDDWDFNWQGGYYFKKFIIIPKNSTVVAEAEYDNTTNNPRNPNQPPALVYWGENTKDEMFYFPLLFVPYKVGDEKLIFDTTTDTKEIVTNKNNGIKISPNPASSEMVNIELNLQVPTKLEISLFDISGKMIRKIRNGEFYLDGKHLVQLDASNINPGTYFLRIENETSITSEQLIITK
jgi:hypothetical protein